MADSAEHLELMGVIFAAVAVIKGVPRDRYKAWARNEGIDGLDNEDALDYYDWVDTMVEVDFRVIEDEDAGDD